MAKDIFNRDRFQRKHSVNPTHTMLITQYNATLKRVASKKFMEKLSDKYSIDVKSVHYKMASVIISIGSEVITTLRYSEYEYWSINTYGGDNVTTKIMTHLDHAITTYIGNPFKRDTINRLQTEYKLKKLGF